MRKRVLFFAAIAIVLSAGVWCIMAPASLRPTSPETGITYGKTAPTFALNGLDGNSVTIGKKGKITVLNFWATWCPPCRQEMPELESFSKKHKDTVLFYAVNLQEPDEQVKAFISKNQYQMPVLLDSEGAVTAKFVIRAIPTTIILNEKGVIKFRKSGPVTADELESVLKEL